MRNTQIFASLALVGIVWNGLSAQQETQPRPGPGSGITTVKGSVVVEELPDVHARQRGDWRVAVSELPPVSVSRLPAVSIAGLPFVRGGGRYLVTWPDGGTEPIIVAEVGADGWVRVAQRKARWINLATARAVEAEE